MVIFAHGSGSSRFSPRNRQVAETLDQRGLATLLIDLLTEDEEAVDERTAHLRFDVEMLADRLVLIGRQQHRRMADTGKLQQTGSRTAHRHFARRGLEQQIRLRAAQNQRRALDLHRPEPHMRYRGDMRLR